MKCLLLILAVFSLFLPQAEARIYIPIDQPSEKSFPIAICDFPGGGRFGEEVAEIIRNNLKLSGYFHVLENEGLKQQCREEGSTIDTIHFSFWAASAAQALIKGSVEREGKHFIFTIRLFDPYAPLMLIGKEYTAKNTDIREVAHRFSDEVMQELTGIRGVFNTKIAFTADTGKRRKELFVMDMDGARLRKLTNFKTITISPAWSPKGDQLAFTSYREGDPDIYTMKLDGKNLKRLTFGEGTKITPVWSPSGDWLAFSSSAPGEADLFLMKEEGKKLKRLTFALGIDLSPDYSPDGKELVFASERAGNLHLFKTSVDGIGPATRLTFVGYQNDMPTWSPRADKIAFSGRDQGTFDIFIMNPDGSHIQRLTVRSGSNEHPSFSPDGRFIVFQSDREGSPAIYLMRIDGSNQTRISPGGGMLPSWSPRFE